MKLLTILCLFFLFSCVEELPVLEKEEALQEVKLTSVSSESVTAQSALIKIKLEGKASASVAYGPSQQLGSKSLISNNLLSEHTISLIGLSADQVYYFQVSLKSSDGKEILSNILSFKTDKVVPPSVEPMITMFRAEDISFTKASIYWELNQASNAQVEYGKTSSLGLVSAKDNNFKMAHKHTLENLSEDTVYFFRVRSVDQKGKEVVSSLMTLKTLKPVPVILPVISNIQTQDIGLTSAAVYWELNKEANGQIEYGKSQAFGELSIKENGFLKIHKQKLMNLSSDTVYYYRVRSTDQQGKEVLSQVMSFRTLKPEPVLTAKAPVLKSAVLAGEDYVLTFEKASLSLDPAGGYDTYINSIDQNDNVKFAGFSRTLAGLDIYTKQCFKIQARYTQMDPTVLVESNELCVAAKIKPAPVLTAKAPVLKTAVLSGNNYVLTFEKANLSLDPAGGYDTYINNIDQNDNKSFSGFSRTLSSLDIYAKQCFKIQARYTQMDPVVLVESNELCVAAQDRPVNPPVSNNAPLSQTVKDMMAKFDRSYAKYYNSRILPQISSGNELQEYYYVSYWYEGIVQAWQATGDNKYLDTVLDFTEIMMNDATPIAGTNYLGWPSTNDPTNRKYSADRAKNGTSLWDAFMFRFVASLLRKMHHSPNLRKMSDYESRYQKILAFVEKNVWDRWYLKTTRHSAIYRSRTHMASHWARIGMELHIITGKPEYKKVFDNISFAGMPADSDFSGASLRKQLSLNKSVPSAYIWPAVWNGNDIQDTSHAGAIVAFWSTAFNNNYYWNETDIKRVVSAFKNLVLVENNDVYVKQYVNGSGETLRAVSVDYQGWAELGRYDKELQAKLVKRSNGYFYSSVLALNQRILDVGRPFYPEYYAPVDGKAK